MLSTIINDAETIQPCRDNNKALTTRMKDTSSHFDLKMIDVSIMVHYSWPEVLALKVARWINWEVLQRALRADLDSFLAKCVNNRLQLRHNRILRWHDPCYYTWIVVKVSQASTTYGFLIFVKMAREGSKLSKILICEMVYLRIICWSRAKPLQNPFGNQT